MKIIAAEAQIDQDKVDPNTEFADLGVDSLLSLNIASRLQEELNIDITSTAFVDYPTIKALISYIGRDEATVIESTQSSSIQSGVSTPVSNKDENEDTYSTDASTLDDDSSGPKADIMATVRNVISQETGLAIEDISSDMQLADLGVDSLLGLTIIGVLSEQIGTGLPSSLLMESETLDDVERKLREIGVIDSPKPKETAAENATASAEGTDARLSMMSKNYDRLIAPPHATSIVLQGSPKTARKILFLFPDGAGSATSYLALPRISSDVVVYGLNCPWLKTPQELKCSFGHYVAKFLVEILRRQPHGPYSFGGASAGGILAYEAAQQLERVGEKVARLILLDSPDPVGLENPHQRMYDFLESLGMFGMNGKAPKWLRPHFDAFLVLLDRYNVKPFAGSDSPTTYIIYARDGMCKYDSDPRPEMRPDDPREMWWLLNNRTDFSGGGWNTLLGKENLHISVFDDVNHYTILQEGPKIQELSVLLGRAMGVLEEVTKGQSRYDF